MYRRLYKSNAIKTITATTFKYIDANLHPICVVFIENDRVKYWKKSSDMKVKLGNYVHLFPPKDSVAAEHIENNYDYIYILLKINHKRFINQLGLNLMSNNCWNMKKIW